ncbi:MAG: DUF3261 domain-containing protein [Pseudomonadota bacterium]
MINRVMIYAWVMPKKILQSLLLILVADALSGCSFLAMKKFPLSSMTSETRTSAAQQQWQLSYNDEQYLLQVIVERMPTHWQWIMLNNLGQRLATATVTGSVINIEQQQSHPVNKLIPDLLEAIQFSYWSLTDLQKIGNTEWSFAETAGHRDIYFSGILHATVDYQSSDGASAEDHANHDSKWQGGLKYEKKNSYDKKSSYDNKKGDFYLVIESQLLN